MSDEKDKKKKKKKKELKEFLPDLVRDSSKEFIQKVSDDVDVYKKIRMINGLPPNQEADEFAARWNLGKYHLCPEVLTLFYDHWDELCEGDGGLLGTFEDSQKNFYQKYHI